VFLVEIDALDPGVLEKITAHLRAKFQLSEQDGA